jgi:hypothetical protein
VSCCSEFIFFFRFLQVGKECWKRNVWLNRKDEGMNYDWKNLETKILEMKRREEVNNKGMSQ